MFPMIFGPRTAHSEAVVRVAQGVDAFGNAAPVPYGDCPAGHGHWSEDLRACVCDAVEESMVREVERHLIAWANAPRGATLVTCSQCPPEEAGTYRFSHHVQCGDGFYRCTKCAHTIGWEDFWRHVDPEEEPSIIADYLVIVPKS